MLRDPVWGTCPYRRKSCNVTFSAQLISCYSPLFLRAPVAVPLPAVRHAVVSADWKEGPKASNAVAENW
jgi:hypothetical protein